MHGPISACQSPFSPSASSIVKSQKLCIASPVNFKNCCSPFGIDEASSYYTGLGLNWGPNYCQSSVFCAMRIALCRATNARKCAVIFHSKWYQKSRRKWSALGPRQLVSHSSSICKYSSRSCCQCAWLCSSVSITIIFLLAHPKSKIQNSYMPRSGNRVRISPSVLRSASKASSVGWYCCTCAGDWAKCNSSPIRSCTSK